MDKRTVPIECIKKKGEAVGKKSGVSDAVRNSISSKVGIILKREGITRAELACRMNISTGRISQILNSETISVAKLEEIASALGYEVEISFLKTSDRI